MKKAMLYPFLPLLLFLCLITMASAAPEITDQGECGDGVTWTLDSAGTLTISGSWYMTDYGSAGQVPWYLERESVKSIVVEPGVRSWVTMLL